MNAMGEHVLRKRKDMLREKLKQIAGESENIRALLEDIRTRAAWIVSDLDVETDDCEFLRKYSPATRKLDEWQIQVSRISYELEYLVCKENRKSTTSRERHRQDDDEDIRLWTIPCLIQEKDILDMRFVSGDSPHDFWLRFYSTKELREIRTGIQKLFEANKLQPLKFSEVFGGYGYVCVCDGSDHFRGKVINRCTDSSSYMVLNIDNGDILKVEKDNVYDLTEELAKFPAQAINCCLEGDIGDRALWDDCDKLFHQVMGDSTLVVIVCSVPNETCSKFVVKVDVHNDRRVKSKIELSSWITYSVLPTLIQKRTSKSLVSLKPLFDSLRKINFESNASLKESIRGECGSETQNAERKKDQDSINLSAENNANGISDSSKEKSHTQELLSRATQHSSSLSLSSTPVYAESPIKGKSEGKSWLPSIQQQSNAFRSLINPPLHTMPMLPTHVPFFSYQNPSLMTQMGSAPPINQPICPYIPQIQPPLLEINSFHNAGPSVILQQNQPQSFHFQINSPAEKKLFTKQHTPKRLPAVGNLTFLQSNTENAQKGRGCGTHISLEDKEKEAISNTNTLHATHLQMETTSVIKQTPFAKPEASEGDFSVCKQETSPPKVNSKITDRMGKVSLRYPNLKFDVGERYQAFVVHINNPDEFYIHVACKYTAFIETLDKEMTENYNICSIKLRNKEEAKTMLNESWCAVFYKDEHLWHRGKVIDWKDDNDQALEVQYVDYGEVREVDLSMIKPLKEEYTILPICATKCRLANIHPPRVQENSEHNIWPPETIELFKVLSVRDKLHSFIVTNTSSDSIAILLVTEDNVVINKALLDLEYAIAFNPIEFDTSLPIQVISEEEVNVGKDDTPNGSAQDKLTEDCQKEDRLMNGRPRDLGKTAGYCQKMDDQENILQNWDPMAEDYFSVDNTEYHDDENACYAVSGYVPQDEQRICAVYAKYGRCFKGVACSKEHRMPNPNGWTTDQEAVLQNPYVSLELPPVGSSITVEITAIYTLSMFYAHILWKGIFKKNEETLTSLNKYINSKDNVSKMKRFHIIPAVGQLVLARFMADGNENFYRARVIDTNIEENKVQVMYTDYGNTEWVSEKNIREIESQYLHLPFQASECYIGHMSSSTHNEEALAELSDLILGKQLVGTLVSKDMLGHAEIELWDGNEKISDKLIKKGYAVYRESPLFSTRPGFLIPG